LSMTKAMEALRFSAQYFYKRWYQQDVAPHLTHEQKEALMHKISEMTLREAIWLDRDTDFTEQFPELKPHAHTKITGLQLVTVMEAIFEELYRPVNGQRKLHV